jgi:hypothetical protein
MLAVADRDVLAHATNELPDSTGSMVDGAHYSDYPRTLNLSPDGQCSGHGRFVPGGGMAFKTPT